MPFNRTKNRGHKQNRRPRQKSRNRSNPTADKSGRIPDTNLVSITAVAGQPTKLDVAMDRNVIAGTPAPVDTSAFVLTASGGTSRHAIAAVNQTPNVARVTLDGALTASHSYTGKLAITQGVIIPAAGVIGHNTGTINT